MNIHRCRAGAFATLTSLLLAWSGAQAEALEGPGAPPPVPEDSTPAAPVPGVEVQARGPIHEAYAQPNEAGGRPVPGPVIDRQPPAPVPETPPEQRPEGDNVVWVPGYFAYDADRSDYVWVSGFWRVAPPNRKWVPGYWAGAERRWQWVSGFWAPARAEEVPYVDPPPPPPAEAGPSIPPPDDNSTWVNGAWVYRESRYLWRPGFYLRQHPGFVYCPPRFFWTPSGSVFVDAYWDRCLEDRGVLFAPVYFTQPLWRRPGWAFQPSYVLNGPGLLGSLWVGPGGRSYAFGDYYGAGYQRLGYQPWVTHGPRSGDPLFGYYRWQNRANPAWQRGLLATHQGRVRGALPLPPRTFVAQQNFIQGARTSRRYDRTTIDNLAVVQPLHRYAATPGAARLTRVSPAEGVARRRTATAYQSAVVARRNLEARGASRGSARPSALSVARIPAPAARPSAARARPSTLRTPAARGALPSTLPRQAERRSVSPPTAGMPRPKYASRPSPAVRRTPSPAPATTFKPRSISPPRAAERRLPPTRHTAPAPPAAARYVPRAAPAPRATPARPAYRPPPAVRRPAPAAHSPARPAPQPAPARSAPPRKGQKH